ncbi:hypothetical protein [Streptomyces mangrovi]|uniref:hypothetical protein n=1 Tax=Streptomyces mangrovi TaxID=1206892 RepID=UPI00399CF20C
MRATTIPASREQLRATYPGGSYVLYRDPALYLTGRPGHTTICRVRGLDSNFNQLHLADLRTGASHIVDPAYVRPITSAEIMRDIDTAALEHSGDLLTAGDAWLRQQRKTRARA